MNRPTSAIIAGALVLAACGGGEPASTTTEPVASTATTVATTASSEPTTSTQASTTSEATTTTAATTLPPTTVGPPEAGFPPELTELVHGGETWVVVLAAGEAGDEPALVAAVAAATDAGYTTGPTDCDFGAAEAIGASAGSLTVSVYLMSEDDARQALAAFEAAGVTGGVVALVETYCLD